MVSRSVLALLAAGLSIPAVAQASVQSVGQPLGQPLGGPQVTGVCLLSQQAVVADTKVGVAANARLKQLAGQAQTEVDAGRGSIEADARTLESQRASIKPADYQARREALATRLQTLQQTAQGRSRQIELTREQALGQIASAAQPVIAQVYKARGCGLLVDRVAVLGGNMTNDLTAAVVQGIDAKMTTISFGLAPLPAGDTMAAR